MCFYYHVVRALLCISTSTVDAVYHTGTVPHPVHPTWLGRHPNHPNCTPSGQPVKAVAGGLHELFQNTSSTNPALEGKAPWACDEPAEGNAFFPALKHLRSLGPHDLGFTGFGVLGPESRVYGFGVGDYVESSGAFADRTHLLRV